MSEGEQVAHHRDTLYVFRAPVVQCVKRTDLLRNRDTDNIQMAKLLKHFLMKVCEKSLSPSSSDQQQRVKRQLRVTLAAEVGSEPKHISASVFDCLTSSR